MDAKIAQEVCCLVTSRAASLIAISIIALAEFVMAKVRGSDIHKLTVALDGGVIEMFGTLREQIEGKIQELTQIVHGDDNFEIVLMPTYGGSCLGAAVLCAAS